MSVAAKEDAGTGPVAALGRNILVASEETGLPSDDPVRYGASVLLDSVLATFEAQASGVLADH